MIHTTADTFIADAKRGDVVLMANTTHLSHLIRYGTRRPFSHAGLIINEDGDMRSAYPGHGTDDRPVHVDSLHTLMQDSAGGGGAHKFDEVFLLRPQCSASEIDAVIEKSVGISDQAEDFHQFDIARLVIMLLCQEPYRGEELHPLLATRWRDRVAIHHALNILWDLIAAEDDPTSLVCSEFVYRCFEEAGSTISLPDPIVKLPLPPPHATEAKPAVPPGSLLHAGMERGRLDGLTEVLRTGRTSAQAWADDVLDELDDHWDRIKDFVLGVQTHRARLPLVEAEFVTPGDLIGSPDLSVASIFVRTSWHDG